MFKKFVLVAAFVCPALLAFYLINQPKKINISSGQVIPAQSKLATAFLSATIAPTRTSPIQAPVFNHAIANRAEAALLTPLLFGTNAPAGIAFDGNGNLKKTKNLRDVFEYYWATLYDAGIDGVRYLVVHQGKQQLLQAHDTVRNKALAELDNTFVRYAALKMAESNDESLAARLSPRARVERLHNMRKEYLGETLANAFYAEQEAHDLSFIQRQESAEQGMPQLVQNDQERQIDDLAKDQEDFNRRQLSPQQRYQIRLSKYGEEIARNWLVIESKTSLQ